MLTALVGHQTCDVRIYIYIYIYSCYFDSGIPISHYTRELQYKCNAGANNNLYLPVKVSVFYSISINSLRIRVKHEAGV